MCPPSAAIKPERACNSGSKPGWLCSTLGKTQLYDKCADACKNSEVVLCSFATYSQLALIDGSTLRAPDGEHDDRADAFALACTARTMRKRRLWFRMDGVTYRYLLDGQRWSARHYGPRGSVKFDSRLVPPSRM